ncbi:MFS transporter [uncultured Leifsonia sp.]|uniref:MFS transporter n=1 Tax=uncultured Leifsonia sp. TaxID=340359 RepID=UPI0028D4E6EE|nr:MFS transporter [uncultured Leifsonia sp.]
MSVGERTRSAVPVLSPILVVAGLLLVAGNLRAGLTTVGPVLDQIRADLGLTSVEASALVSLPLLAFAVVSPFAPRLARALGLERSLALALVVLAAGLVLRSLPALAALWAGTALIGVAIAVLNVILPALVKRDFPTRIGQMTGAYSVVQSVFAALAAGVAVPVAGLSAVGWRLPLGMWAVLALVALAVLAPQLRRRTVVPESQDDVTLDTGAVVAQSLRSPWRSALGWQVTAFMGLQSVGFYVFITWLPSIETASGISREAAGLHQLFLNGFGIVGSIACSFLIPRFRDQRLLAVLAPSLIVVAVLGVLLAPALSGVWDSIAGVAGGASIVLALSFFGLRTTHHAQAAALSGMAQSVGYLVAAAGPIAVGALHDATGSWTPPLLVLAGIQLVLICFGLLAGRARVIG